MVDLTVEHEATLWMAGDVPIRMFYGDRRWRVSDTPTRLRESIWASAGRPPSGLYGWRFQATDEKGETFVFDVYKAKAGWHVHHAYS